MKKIIRERQNGKTTELIKISAETQCPIVCVNEHMSGYIMKQASTLELNIPKPISIYNFDEKTRGHNYKNGILVDDAELILERLLQIPIYALSMSCPTKISKTEIAIRLGLDPSNLEITD